MRAFAPAVIALVLLAAAAPGPVRGQAADAITSGENQQGTRTATPAPQPSPAAIARLRLEPDGGGYQVWADNLLHGPIEVMLHSVDGAARPARPALPARATVPTLGSRLVAYIPGATPPRLRLAALPGQPGGHHRNVEYRFPLLSPQLRVGQGWGGHFSHREPENLYAVDLGAEVGTPVLAARDGMVMQIESGFHPVARKGPGTDGQANFVRILHDDGTMALYAHLDAGGVHVRPGERVRRGQRIGLSGNTGFSSGPHLHFVIQANHGMRLQSLPFRMFGPGGIIRFPDPATLQPAPIQYRPVAPKPL